MATRSERANIGGILRWPSRLERQIAQRYLKSKRGSRVASLNTVISTGGVAVGVLALIVVLGVMNGLRDDLRERILIANPHLRILTFGAGEYGSMVMFQIVHGGRPQTGHRENDTYPP